MEYAEGVHLFRTGERRAEVDALADRMAGRVGLDGMLQDLNRSATTTRVPGPAPSWGFTWNDEDNASRRWFPQGITTSADQGDPSPTNGRAVVCTSWYSKDVHGLNKGARVTFVDVTDRSMPRYRHVLLVEAVLTGAGRLELRPVRVHAGGLVWHGRYLHVAGTARGICSFRLDDVVRVETLGDPSVLRVRPDGGIDGFGYRYLLPLRFTYDAVTDDGVERLRYSFLSIDRSTSPHQLVAGEFGRGRMSTRLVRYELDPETSLLSTSAEGVSRPLFLSAGGIEGMQGAAVVGGTYYVTTSAGRWGRGSVYVGRPGSFRRHARVLPPGPEDISYWPDHDELWSLTEHPGRRFVFTMDRARFD